MDLGISGRTAVVTGASRGLGARTAELLEAEGARVVRVSRTEGIDVTSPDAPAQVVQLAGGPIDILVNNAGTSAVKALGDLTDDDWLYQYSLNVLGPMRLMRELAPAMAERGWGRIVNVSSTAGKRPSLTNAAYSVTKAAQLSLSRTFANAYAGTGVAVNAVTPAAVAGSLWLDEGGLADQVGAARSITRDEALAQQAASLPIGRMLTQDEVAAAAVFLCSDRASGVTGAAWSVDGGSVPTIL